MPRKTPLQRQYPWVHFEPSSGKVIAQQVPIALARRLYQIFSTLVADVLANEQVSSPLAYHALALIDDNPAIDQRRLAALMGIDRTNVGQIVDDLETKGLVERRVNGADRRARELRVTASAADLRRRMLPKNLAAQAAVLAALNPAERVVLVDLLTRVVEANEIHAKPGAGRRPPKKRAYPPNRPPNKEA
jgi:MarR family transcriptional regulator, temperature-dependent positive regulator of motility